MPSIEPRPEQLERFLLEVTRAGPVVMINLLRYREHAKYPPDCDATACSGREAYQRYAAVAVNKVAGVGGRIVWVAAIKGALIGPEGEEWDDAALVEYPSRQAFVEMVSQPEYQAAAVHRTAALADSRLLVTEPGTLLDALQAPA
jgi:uncharacterized protein (DUF1330 family)